jgi:glyoxylase-like metal-dependent hydrolase (beta-lactamase superfamily II)
MHAHRDYADGITLIDSGYERPGLAAFYLIVEKGRAAFIDTGTAHSLPNALSALRAHGLTAEQVDYVIPTHVHLDHAGGAGEMMRRFPEARLVVHPRGARHLVDPAKLSAGVAAVYGAEQAHRRFGALSPVEAKRVIEAPDKFSLSLNGRPLLFLDTPGHARHHFCVVDERAGAIFTGDTFGISYREFDTERGAFILPTTTPVQFEPDALHTSIDLLVALEPRQLLLTHFGRVTEIERLAADLHRLIDEFVELGIDVKDAGSQRRRRLIEGQRALIVPRLRTHGCTLDDARIDLLLEMDFDLNAQGIEVWLDRDA